MSTIAQPAFPPVELHGPRRLAGAFSDTLQVAGRDLKMLIRSPQLVIFSVIQPVLFVLMFRYVFGGAIRVPGVSYVDFLLPGVFAQVVAFGAMNAAVGLATDVSMGHLERFRSLPMAPAAVLAGRTMADLVRNVVVVALMAAVGFAVGFRVHAGVADFVLAVTLMVLFGYAFSWLFVVVGLSVSSPETAQAASVPLLLLLVFASSAFVPVQSMPGWLQVFAAHQPITAEVDAVRALTLGGPLTADLVRAVAWTVGILIVAVPLSAWRFRKSG